MEIEKVKLSYHLVNNKYVTRIDNLDEYVELFSMEPYLLMDVICSIVLVFDMSYKDNCINKRWSENTINYIIKRIFDELY